MTDWRTLSARASLASHRLIGWIYWDPRAIELYTNLGIPNGVGYYVASRGAPLLPAGHQAVSASFYSIRADFIEFAVTLADQHTSWQEIFTARNQAVGEGLRQYVPEICEGLAALDGDLWRVADALPESGRVCFAAHRQAPRDEDPLVSAWLAVNCIREWRGDTHFAILASEDISGVQAGLLHDAYLGYPGDWIPRSRGADDAQLEEAWNVLDARGFVTDGRINEAGLAYREYIEDKTNELCEKAWRSLGAELTEKYCALIEPVGHKFLARIDATAGENWMPAARDSRRK